MTTEAVSGRSILRYRGEPVTHKVSYRDAPAALAGYRPRAEIASCACGWSAVIDGGHSARDKARLARMHAGVEDPPEGVTP